MICASVLLVSSTWLWVPAAAAADTQNVPIRENKEAPLRFFDPPQKFVPARPRDDRDRDMLEAASRYSHARLLAKRALLPEALRQYQRTFRLKGSESGTLAEIVSLAMDLNRPSVAARYALYASADDQVDPTILHRLSLHLSDQNRNSESLKLYELIEQQADSARPNSSYVFRHYEMARLYFASEQYGESADSYEIVREALERPDRFGIDQSVRKLLLGRASITYSMMAESFLRAGRTLGAAALFRLADQENERPAVLAFQLARVAWKESKPREALEKLDEYLRSKSFESGTEPYRLLADIMGKQHPKDHGDLLTSRLETLHRDDPRNPALGYFLAQHYRERGLREKSDAIFEQLVKTAPVLEGIRVLVEKYIDEVKLEELLALLSTLTRQTGDLKALGESSDRLYKNTHVVDGLIELAAQRQKELTAPEAFAVASIALEAGRNEQASRFFEAYLRKNSQNKHERLMTWGLELFLKEQYAAAVDIFRRSVDADAPTDIKAISYFYLAGALELAGDTGGAVKAVDQAITFNNSSILPYSRRAWLLYHAGRDTEAEHANRELIERFDANYSSSEVREVLKEARSALSNICVADHRLSESEEWLEQILDEFPDDVGALNDLGYLWADQNKNLHRAIDMVTRAANSEPDNVAYRDSLGWALFRLGRYGESIRELEKAAKGEQPDGVILEHLGDVYAKLGDSTAARTHWQRALEAFERINDQDRISAVKAKMESPDPRE